MIYIGVDLHLRFCYMTVLDATGSVLHQGTVSSQPEKLAAFFQEWKRLACKKEEGGGRLEVVVEACGFWRGFRHTVEPLPGTVARKDGDAQAALQSAAKRIEAEYEVPYLAHATMEPMNCVADVRADACEIWLGSQFQTMDQAAAAEEAGLKPQQVKVHTTFLGGGFGRRATGDCHVAREAVQISKAVKAPVKVI